MFIFRPEAKRHRDIPLTLQAMQPILGSAAPPGAKWEERCMMAGREVLWFNLDKLAFAEMNIVYFPLLVLKGIYHY